MSFRCAKPTLPQVIEQKHLKRRPADGTAALGSKQNASMEKKEGAKGHRRKINSGLPCGVIQTSKDVTLAEGAVLPSLH